MRQPMLIALMMSAMTLFPSAGLFAARNENNSTDRSADVFGVHMDKDGYIAVPEEGKNNKDEQRQNALIKSYEKQQKDFIKQQEEIFKKGYNK